MAYLVAEAEQSIDSLRQEEKCKQRAINHNQVIVICNLLHSKSRECAVPAATLKSSGLR
jgi:hypothetical protein